MSLLGYFSKNFNFKNYLLKTRTSEREISDNRWYNRGITLNERGTQISTFFTIVYFNKIVRRNSFFNQPLNLLHFLYHEYSFDYAFL